MALIRESGNDYLIGLKENQPTLCKTAEIQQHTSPPLSQATVVDNTHARYVQRHVQVFPAPPKLQRQWAGLTSFVIVERSGQRDGQPFIETQYYISSQSQSASEFLRATQAHWGIENRLHWVKDVTFAEDFPLRRGGNAPVNWAILHNFFITIARYFGFRTIPQAQRALANQLQKVFSFFV